jgi:hypothetical protein
MTFLDILSILFEGRIHNKQLVRIPYREIQRRIIHERMVKLERRGDSKGSGY